jgi:hypothetical protein
MSDQSVWEFIWRIFYRSFLAVVTIWGLMVVVAKLIIG